MKQKIGALVLFSLLILTVFALIKTDGTRSTATPSTTSTAQRATN